MEKQVLKLILVRGKQIQTCARPSDSRTLLAHPFKTTQCTSAEWKKHLKAGLMKKLTNNVHISTMKNKPNEQRLNDWCKNTKIFIGKSTKTPVTLTSI